MAHMLLLLLVMVYRSELLLLLPLEVRKEGLVAE
jgi:hypothetical protein